MGGGGGLGASEMPNRLRLRAIMNAGNAWVYVDGGWREVRDTTEEEMRNVDGEAQNLGIGEFAEYTFSELPAYGPNYVEFPMGERENGHPDM